MPGREGSKEEVRLRKEGQSERDSRGDISAESLEATPDPDAFPSDPFHRPSEEHVLNSPSLWTPALFDRYNLWISTILGGSFFSFLHLNLETILVSSFLFIANHES